MIDYFVIYQLKDNESYTHDEDSIVEDGLSSGELRQALLDRLKNALVHNYITLVNNNLAKYDLSINEKKIKNKKGMNQAVEDIDNVLYHLTDDELNDTVWVFSNERIYVAGFEED